MILTVNVRGFRYQLLPVISAVQRLTVSLLDTANWYLLLSCIFYFILIITNILVCSSNNAHSFSSYLPIEW